MTGYSNDITKINGSYVPRHFVSDGEYAWFVEGFTTDQFSTWRTKVAPLLPNGQPDMKQVTSPNASTADLLGTDPYMLRLMIGNVQRLCQGLPVVRIKRVPSDEA